MTRYTYYGVYKQSVFLKLRYSEVDGWQIGIDYNNDGEVKSHHWERLTGALLKQVEPAVRDHGFALPRYIASEEMYEQYLARADALMDARPDTKEMKELELLARAIQDYEDVHYPIDKPAKRSEDQDTLF